MPYITINEWKSKLLPSYITPFRCKASGPWGPGGYTIIGRQVRSRDMRSSPNNKIRKSMDSPHAGMLLAIFFFERNMLLSTNLGLDYRRGYLLMYVYIISVHKWWLFREYTWLVKMEISTWRAARKWRCRWNLFVDPIWNDISVAYQLCQIGTSHVQKHNIEVQTNRSLYL
jgi:hypothetical protein